MQKIEDGLLQGKSHARGGIKLLVKPDNYTIEAEGDEFIICKTALLSGEIHEYHNKTNLEILQNLYDAYSCHHEGNVVNSGEYDLEVDSLNLQAKTISRSIAKAGLENGKSVFSRHSVLEKNEVNALKKPFKKEELDAMLEESLGKLSAEDLRDKTIKDLNEFTERKIKQEQEEADEHWKKIKNGVTNEASYKRMKTESEKQEYFQERMDHIEDAIIQDKHRIQIRFDNSRQVLTNILKFFHVGRVVAYPSKTYAYDNSFTRAVFLGFDIKETIKNPYAPSAVKLRFAMSSSEKYIALPASKQDIIPQIQSLTYSELRDHEQADVIERWDEICKKASADRQQRYIVTGNILQAFGDDQLKGKLISFTTNDGGVKKGILLPESFDPHRRPEKNEKGFRITVPIIKALPVIKSMIEGRSVETSDRFGIIRRANDYRILVPAPRKQGGKFYTNTTLIQMTNEKNFNKIAQMMEATIDLNKIGSLVNFLQDNFNCTISLIPEEAERMLKGANIDYKDEVDYDKGKEVLDKLSEADRTQEFLKEEKIKESALAETSDRKKLKVRHKLLEFSRLLSLK